MNEATPIPTDKFLGLFLLIVGFVAVITGLWLVWPAIAISVAGVALGLLGIGLILEVKQ